MSRAALGLGVLCGMFAALQTAEAVELYTVNTATDTLEILNTDTTSFASVGALGVPFDFGDLAWDSDTGTMYMVQGFAGTGLYTVDIGTGSATFVGDHGSGQMFGLAIDPNTGILYGSESTTGTGFYEIDKSTGAKTLIGDPGVNLDALTWDSTRNQMVGVLAGAGNYYIIDTATGGLSDQGTNGFVNNCGMAYDPGSDDIWVIDWSGVLFNIDPATFSGGSVASGLGAHDGLVFAGEPASGPKLTTGTCPGPNMLTMTGMTPGGQVAMLSAGGPGSMALPGGPCAGATSGLGAGLTLRATFNANALGEAVVTPNLSAGACGNWVQALDVTTCEFTNAAEL